MTARRPLVDNRPSPFGTAVQTLPLDRMLILGGLEIEASEAVTAPALVNVYDLTGAARVRYANATAAGREASGFVLTDVALGELVVVYPAGPMEGLLGLIPGPQFLATTDGQVTDSAPSGSGNIVQRVGEALSATLLSVAPGIGIQRR